jgi:hypothetical protein
MWPGYARGVTLRVEGYEAQRMGRFEGTTAWDLTLGRSSTAGLPAALTTVRHEDVPER